MSMIRQSFSKRRSKPFIEKLSDFIFAVDFGHGKNSLFEGFIFSKPVKLTLDTSVKKNPLQKEGLAPNNDPKNYSKNITAARELVAC